MAKPSASAQEHNPSPHTPLLSNQEPDQVSGPAATPLSVLILYFMAIHFLLAFCEIILVAPFIKLLENSLCLSYYNFPGNGVQDELCKIPDIQGPLATLRGWKSSFDTIPVLLVAIPFGRLGDRYGRRKILATALVGVAASLCEVFVVCAFPKVFPVRLVWLSSILLLCGGGLNSASAYMWAMASEAIPSKQRSHGFYYIFSAFYVAELIASFVASVTTDISPWIPCSLAMGSIILCLILLAVMPDPRGSKNHSESPESHIAEDYTSRTITKPTTTSRLLTLLSNPNILFTVPVFLVGILRYTTLNVLIQYANIRFHLPLSTGATFYTETAGINILLFLFLIPALTSHIRTNYAVRPQTIDLFLVRTSVCLMSMGSLAIGLAPTTSLLPLGVAIFSTGFGSRVSALSLISTWITPSDKATVYASITVLESLGHAVGDPGMQHIFAASLRLENFWLAMPFFVAAGCYCLATISTMFIRIEKEVEGEGEDE
ncbi:Efflux pump [Lachnellula hyalina]|uniref:Efflux pump n=1 Tax=Lachnellula hyalina TaxID=1316788 RepID=A0A8H8TVK8_9HELO|nr:Efflux pump [Lachnellula hyalina]TVY23472.1 Efflux pump [Lachnellula hyalina]